MSCRDWTEEARAAVRRALEAWDAVIAQEPPRRITVGLYWMDFAAMGRGISMGGSTVQIVPPAPLVPGALLVQTRPERVWRDGVEVDASQGYDILLCFNCSPGLFYFGAEAGADIGMRHDFQSVIMHEVGHGLGITSAVRRALPQGARLCTACQTVNGGKTMLYTAFDALMVNAAGERVVERAAAQLARTGLASGFDAGETIGLAGSPLRIYNPPAFKSGSSVTHVDREGALMRSSYLPGSFQRLITKEEQGLMKLMGWKVAEVAAP